MPQLTSDTMVYDDIYIEAFRGLKELKLKQCGAVNLLVGGNNSGKTSVLEAILLLANPLDPSQWDACIELRSTWPLMDLRFSSSKADRLNGIEWLFPHREDGFGTIAIHSTQQDHNSFVARHSRIAGEAPNRTEVGRGFLVEGVYRGSRDREMQQKVGPDEGIEIEIEIDSLVQQASLFDEDDPIFRLTLWDRGRTRGPKRRFLNAVVSTVFATPISHRSDGYLGARVSRLLRTKRKSQAIELLQTIDPAIVDLVMVMPEEPDDSVTLPRRGSAATLHVDHESLGLVPIHAMGDGLRRAIHLAILVAEVGPGGVLLIDEIEVGMHTSVLREVFSWLGQVCREQEIQVFATTHSLETIDAILASVPDSDLVLFRLRDDQVRRFSGDLLRTVRFELGQEVR